MGKKIRVIIALAIIVGVAFWAFDSVRQRSYSGSRLSFEVGNGHVVVTNLGTEAIPVEMRTQGRAAAFRIQSAELDLRESSKRQGSGRNAYHTLSFELPSGQATIDVTSGTGVQFIATGNGRMQAVVTPMDAETSRVTLGFAAIVILVALYYLSRVLEHRWIGVLRSRLPGRGQGAKSAPA